jgi:hypothetical protein
MQRFAGLLLQQLTFNKVFASFEIMRRGVRIDYEYIAIKAVVAK